MRKILLNIIYFFLFLTSNVYGEKNIHQIIKKDYYLGYLSPIMSTYNDIGNNSKISIEGTIFFFKVIDSLNEERLFGITASHVSQGREIRINNQLMPVLQSLGRLANNDDDIEIFEFPKEWIENKSVRIMGVWDSERKIIRIDQSTIEKMKSESKHLDQSQVWLNSKNFNFFTLKGDWITQAPIPYSQDVDKMINLEFGMSKLDKQNISYLPAEDEYYAIARIAPGMSGSPLISESNHYFNKSLLSDFKSFNKVTLKDLLNVSSTENYYIYGLAKSSDRYLPGSWFSTERAIFKILNSYLKGNRNYETKTKWKIRFGLTYRDFGDGSTEISPASQKMGGLGRGDNGDMQKSFDVPWTEFAPLSDKIYYKNFMNFYDLTPGIRYKGEAILGFKLHNKLGFYFEGNPNKLLSYFTSGYDITPEKIDINSNFHEHFIQKFMSLLSQKQALDEFEINQSSDGAMSSKMNIEYSNLKLISRYYKPENPSIANSEAYKELIHLSSLTPYQFVQKRRSEIENRLKEFYPSIKTKLNTSLVESDFESLLFASEMKTTIIDTKKISLKLSSKQILIKFCLPGDNNDLIAIELDRFGRQLINNSPQTLYFSPYISVKSERGNIIYVDLRSLYFVSTSIFTDFSESPGILNLSEHAKFTKNHLERMLIEGPVLRFRNSTSQQIYEIQFNSLM